MRVAVTWALAACWPLVAANLRAQEPDVADEATLPPVTVTPEINGPALDDGTSGNYGYYPGQGSSGMNYRRNAGNSGVITSDQQLVGAYGQPMWTTQRPWGTTRAYVLPAGVWQVEQWVRPTWNEGEPTEYRFLEEIAIGLPGRFQVDLYERWNIEGENHEANHEGVQVEGRWAFADWGDIPLNPTIYAEWIERGGPQEKPNKYEFKFLMADNLLENLYYGSNLILEQETSGERETELGWSHALSTTLIDRVLLGGFECLVKGTTVEGSRSDQDVSFQIGPSLQLRPTDRTFVDVVGLFGTTGESDDVQMFVIFGYQFSSGGLYSISGPAATRGN